MAVLLRPDGKSQSLGFRNLVGRASYCGVPLQDPRASAEHASIYFDKGVWYLRDLASTNGTYLDGNKIDLGRKHPITAGAAIGFGSTNQLFKLTHDEAPRMRLRSSKSHTLVEPQLGLVVLPNEEHPLVTLFQGLDGWFEERDGVQRQLLDQCEILVESDTWLVELPPPGGETAQTGLARMSGWANFDDLFVRFDVSRDREAITMIVNAGQEARSISNRAYHELLLILAEARLAALGSELPESEQGWLHNDELCRRIAGDISKVNVDVFRARQQLDQLGVIESHRIVERRPMTRQLRLGTAAVSINYDVEPAAASKPPESVSP
jgi:pSer/pThr/pTyr-binding forkhead associated (FHA) protein